MATVTAICDRVDDSSGLLSTAGSADRTRTLSFVQQAYDSACSDLGLVFVSSGTAALTNGTADYTLGTAPFNQTSFLEFRDLWISGGQVNTTLERKSEAEIIDARQLSVSSTQPYWYALGGANTLMLYPTPGTGITLNFTYTRGPLTLVESGAVAGTSESTPTGFPAQFHMDVLANKALKLAFEYKRDLGTAQYFDGEYQKALGRLTEFLGRVGGVLPVWIGVDAGAVYRDVYP